MITIAELFPLYSTAYKWLKITRSLDATIRTVIQEKRRIANEYTVHQKEKNGSVYYYILTNAHHNIWHRYDGPAEIIYRNGKLYCETWMFMGKKHRLDGPAETQYYKNGDLAFQSWYFLEKFHRINGPARITYYRNGQIQREEWYEYDVYKKSVYYTRTGKITDGENHDYVDGEFIYI